MMLGVKESRHDQRRLSHARDLSRFPRLGLNVIPDQVFYLVKHNRRCRLHQNQDIVITCFTGGVYQYMLSVLQVAFTTCLARYLPDWPF